MSLAFVKNSLILSFVILCSFSCTLKPKPKTPTRLYLASSLLPLKASLENLAPADLELELSFLSSSLIAQQVSQGASCDALVLADREWQEYLKKQNTRFIGDRVLATNSLVLASLKPLENSSINHIINNLGNHKIIIADPDYVPLGRYSKDALKALNLWDLVQGKILSAHSAHNARVLLEKKMAPYAVLFLSDINPPIHKIAALEQNTHKPVNYIFMTCRPSKQAQVLENLLFSPEFKAELVKHNFGLPHEP